MTAIDDDAFNLTKILNRPYAFIQWKGTDACVDFHCECGAHHHIDDMFLYAIKCHICGTIWEMPHHLFPRKVKSHTCAHLTQADT